MLFSLLHRPALYVIHADDFEAHSVDADLTWPKPALPENIPALGFVA